jgi:hypothetical protein
VDAAADVVPAPAPVLPASGVAFDLTTSLLTKSSRTFKGSRFLGGIAIGAEVKDTFSSGQKTWVVESVRLTYNYVRGVSLCCMVQGRKKALGASQIGSIVGPDADADVRTLPDNLFLGYRYVVPGGSVQRLTSIAYRAEEDGEVRVRAIMNVSDRGPSGLGYLAHEIRPLYKEDEYE